MSLACQSHSSRQIRVNAELAVVEAQHAPVAHRDDEQRAVREPAEARTASPSTRTISSTPPRASTASDVPPEEVREPPAAVVPARALEERAAGEQSPHARMVAGSAGGHRRSPAAADPRHACAGSSTSTVSEPARSAPSESARGAARTSRSCSSAKDGSRFVLRRPPRPPLPPTAHDVVRESKLQLALAPLGIRVPSIRAVCEDASLLGVPFYVMDYVDGHVVTNELPAPLDADPAARRRLADDLVDTLVEIHAADVSDAGAGGVRAAGQLQRAAGQTVCAAVGDQPDARAAGRRGGRDLARRECAGAAACDGRARRLPAGEHDRAGRPHRGGAGLGDGDDRRPTRRRRVPRRDLQRARWRE